MSCIPAETFGCQCTFTYSDWSACQPNGIQTRTMTAQPQPPGCVGVPQMWRSCNATTPQAPSCSLMIAYPQNDPAHPQITADSGCVGAELAISIVLMRLLTLRP